METNNKKREEGGYAILFTVVIVGIISMITMGLAEAAYKQTILSSVARDSTTAFYQADIGSECALYADKKELYLNATGSEFICAGKTLSYKNVDETTDGLGNFEINPSDSDLISSNKCFRIIISKTDDGEALHTELVTSGYNICKKNNLRTVERSIRVSY